jgi:7-cyano-7-deazaguanine synthase
MLGVIIVSGGMDSVTLAHYAKNLDPQGELHLLSFDYGQRHVKELECAIICAQNLNARHDIIDLQQVGKLFAASGSVLVSDNPVPDGHYAEETMKTTVVPNRNAIMLSIATGVAVAEKADYVYAGMHGGDHYIYPDCRADFVYKFATAMYSANQGFWDGNLTAPFVSKTKADLAAIGDSLGVDFRNTWSCYKGGRLHCGTCGTCVERKEAFELSGVIDPTEYEGGASL